MLTANRVQQFLDSAREWDAFLRGQAVSEAVLPHRLAVREQSALFELDLPGYEREDLDVEVEGKELLISAKKKTADKENEGSWKVRERHAVPDEYRFEFPFLIDAEKTEVQYENGTIRVHLEKPEAELPRKLEVK
jgi:HSP20 family protein